MKKLIIITLFILIIMSPFFIEIIFHRIFFLYEYSKIEKPVVTKENYLSYTSQIIKYLFSLNKRLAIYDGNKELQNFFTKDEISHMKDVKNIFLIVTSVYLFSFIFTVIQRKKITYLEIRRACTITIILIIILTSAVIINFDYVFVLFHKVFFRNNLWLLPEESSLIKLFPGTVFFDFTILWFVSAFIIALILSIFQNKLFTSRN